MITMNQITFEQFVKIIIMSPVLANMKKMRCTIFIIPMRFFWWKMERQITIFLEKSTMWSQAIF